MRRAVFLDRDGVINRLVFNPITGEYESPHFVEDLEIFPYVVDCLDKLQEMGYLLFLVSNQPSYAKGKTTLENIKDIHNKLHQVLISGGVNFTDYFYCYHHPNGIVPKYTGVCQCRKPSPYFLREAERKYNLNMADSWLVGDQDTDILCGQTCRLKTILINEPCSVLKRGASSPDFRAQNLEEAIKIISQFEK